MRCTLLVPGALLPASIAADVLAAAHLPRLAQRIARGTLQPLAPAEAPPHLTWLWSRFGGSGPVVTAPYAWRALNEASAITAEDAPVLWHCDPVHFAFARDHLLVTPLDDAPPTPEETAALAAEADAAARESGASLRVIGHRWFLAFDPPWQLGATPLAAALGRSMQEHLPQGPDAARWRKLLTEIQIRWHHAPVNAAREAKGLKAINGVWLHGGGAYASFGPAPVARVFTHDPALRGWALAAGLPPAALHAPEAPFTGGGDALAVFDALLVPARQEAWHAWLVQIAELDGALERWIGQAFAAGADAIDLMLCGERSVRSVTLAAADRWRVWRRTPLVHAFAEPL